MYDIIKKYAENNKDHGLMLVDMPTGSGKTYAAIGYIFDSCMDEKNKNQKYIFVTTLKKNLPYEDLRERFEKAGRPELYDEKVLVIDSNMESVISGWKSIEQEDIPSEIRKKEEYKRLCADLEFVTEQRKNKNRLFKDFLQRTEDNLRKRSEPAFRRVVTECLKQEYSTVEKRISAVRTQKEWQWVAKLYPAVFTREKQVLFMSMDKLMGRNAPIVEPSYLFCESDVIKEALLFIDEFDATKDTVLKKLIENGLQEKVDYLELFKDIYAALHMDQFPAVLTVPSREYQSGRFKEQTPDAVLKGLREKSAYIFDTYSLQFKHRTTEPIGASFQNYLFQDHQFHTILDANKAYIAMISDSAGRINRIDFSDTKPEQDNNNIQLMLGQVRGFIKYFQSAVNILAINYMQRKAENRQPEEDIFTLESAIRSVLSLFRLRRESVDYLTTQIMMSGQKTKQDNGQADFDISFYENGFQYYAFENDTENDMQSRIMMYAFQNTPEKILLRFCQKAKVIGISATATVPTVLGNYDIAYLKSNLQKKYIEVCEEDKLRLRRSFMEAQNGYKDIGISVELLGEKEEYSEKSWQAVFENEECTHFIYEKLQSQLGEGDNQNAYIKNRYVRIALAYRHFVVHDDINSFLCVLTKHPKRGDRQLDRNVLEDIFELTAKRWKPELDAQKSLFILDGAEYDDKKEEMVERLAAGEKLFVISVYQTIGAGQNLQYPVPDSLRGELIKTNDRPLKEEKDFDAIYLDKPTHLVVPLTANLAEENFVQYLYQMEFLQEVSELSVNETMLNIKKAFRTFMAGKTNADPYANVYSKKSVGLLYARYLIQAIGRICRTNLKNKHIYVFADIGILGSIDLSVAEGRIFNPEFMALVDEIRKAGGSACEEPSLENAAALKAERVNKHINQMLSYAWTPATMEKWKLLRELVLKYPTASAQQASENYIIKNYFAALPKPGNVLFYSEENDYNNINVAFQRNGKQTKMVSEAGSKLPDMLRIPGVREWFERNGWATEFKVNDYVMTPPLFHNIYKGVLGEVVGSYLFQEVFGIELEEIEEPGLFELFDYKIANTSVFVDFKNWHEGVVTERTKMLDKIAAKAEKCGCKCVIVANIIAESDSVISRVEKNGVYILSIPSLCEERDGEMCENLQAWKEIWRCINEYRD